MATNAALPPPSSAWRAQLAQTWRNFSPRERSLVLFAGIAVGVLLLWLVAVRPAWRTLHTAPAQLAAAEAQLQQMQRLAAESQLLRGAAPVAPAAAAAALRAATDRLGSGARLQLQGDRATLTFEHIPAPQLAAWLVEARSGARARPAEAQWTRGGQGYSGNVVLLLGPAS